MPASALIDDVWRQFHRLWGLNASGLYDKQGWAQLQDALEELHREAGIERRRQARAQLRIIPHERPG